MFPPRKRTKIIATLGPASDRDDVLRGMIAAGLNVVRINFSHAKHDALRDSVERVRRVSAETGVPVAILGDLRGPRIRVGEMTGGVDPARRRRGRSRSRPSLASGPRSGSA